ncbi:GNAT family N-acetyltransferase [Alkalihalobacillus sp. MEB130]|uniref:GNAT family N-acetyltransferase n=1 Tax=Alkalihalobacillus sp. MEB130 TaxID=2976704 RepID=UPI0037C0632E
MVASRCTRKGNWQKSDGYTLAWCRQHQLHKLCLTVFATNKVAIALYKKVGFIVEGVQKEQVFINESYDDELLMAYFFTHNRKDETT